MNLCYEEVSPKIAFQNFDYWPKEEKLKFNELTDESMTPVNLEYGSPSVLISDSNGNPVNIRPEKVRIYKTADSRLNESLVNLMYEDGNNLRFLETSNYTVTDNNNYLELNTANLDLTKVIKLNFNLDDTDENNNPVIRSGESRKLNEMLKFYTTVNKINIGYTYDLLGNRVDTAQELVKNDTAGGDLVVDNSNNNHYVYSEDKKYLLSDNFYSYTYDIDGYLITKTFKDNTLKFWQYTWDAEGNLTKVVRINGGVTEFGEEYVYDEAGQRVLTIGNNKTTVSIYNGLNLIYESTTDTAGTSIKDLVYAFDNLQMVIEGGSENYYHQDILGTTRFVRDTNWNTKQENIFDPFGKEMINSQIEGNELHYKYATHDMMNNDTGLTYMQARWMDNETGRFASPDSERQGNNWYVYCHNNPTTLVDPKGTISDYFGFSYYYPYYNFYYNKNYFNDYNNNFKSNFDNQWGYRSLLGVASSAGYNSDFNWGEFLRGAGEQFTSHYSWVTQPFYDAYNFGKDKSPLIRPALYCPAALIGFFNIRNTYKGLQLTNTAFNEIKEIREEGLGWWTFGKGMNLLSGGVNWFFDYLNNPGYESGKLLTEEGLNATELSLSILGPEFLASKLGFVSKLPTTMQFMEDGAAVSRLYALETSTAAKFEMGLWSADTKSLTLSEMTNMWKNPQNLITFNKEGQLLLNSAMRGDIYVLGRQVDTAVAKNWPGYKILDIPDWSIPKNDAWIQGIIDKKATVYLGSPQTQATLWDAFNARDTVFARELGQLRAAGYTQVGDYMIPPGVKP